MTPSLPLRAARAKGIRVRVIVRGRPSGSEREETVGTELRLDDGSFRPGRYIRRALQRARAYGLVEPLAVVDFRAVQADGGTVILPLPRAGTRDSVR